MSSPKQTDRKIAVESLKGPQLHINVSAPSRKKMEPIEQGPWEPRGGLWTSTPSEKDSLMVFKFASIDNLIMDGSPLPIHWPNWQGREGMSYHCWFLYPSKRARIATIDTRRDLVRLAYDYGWVRSWKTTSFLPLRGEVASTLDYLAIAEDFDALHVTAHAVEDGELKTEYPGVPAWLDLPKWAGDTTFWFRWRFSKVEDKGPLYAYMKMPPWVFRQAMEKQARGIDTV